jgi:6-phosphogluconolactonase
MASTNLHAYETREALAEALAAGVAAVLAGGLATHGAATLAVSGGSTPALFLRKLSTAGIDWSGITVLLVDERWVPEENDRSNAAFLRRNLLQGPAAAASFAPYYRDGITAREGVVSLGAAHRLERPIDALVLGMGTDGHTASFFPGGDRLAEATDPTTPAMFEAIEAPGSGEPRVTLTLPPILAARFLALHIEGDEKRGVLDEAMRDGPAEQMPIRAVLRGERTGPIEIFWAP